ncbi:MAG: hypothetical protein ACYCVZ_12015 [Streptosporangiaceae bacterium]
MFVTDEVVLDAPVWVACARLASLASCGGLACPAAASYRDGLDGRIPVGPLGHIPGACKLVQVRYLDQGQCGDTTTLAMRWEASGPAGGLFPVLDADISLAPAPGEATRLALTGTYRPPLGCLGTGLDRALLSRIADATVREFVQKLARVLTGPAAPAPDPASGYPDLA